MKNAILQSSTLPTSQTSASGIAEILSNYHVQDKNVRPTGKGLQEVRKYIGFDQMHFYCHKKTVGRVVSIMTKNNTAGHQVLEYFTNDTLAGLRAFPDACGSFDKLPNDTSILAQNCQAWGSVAGKWGNSKKTGKLRLVVMPFSYGNDYVFGMEAGNVNRFSCDDSFDGPFSAGDILRISVR